MMKPSLTTLQGQKHHDVQRNSKVSEQSSVESTDRDKATSLAIGSKRSNEMVIHPSLFLLILPTLRASSPVLLCQLQMVTLRIQQRKAHRCLARSRISMKSARALAHTELGTLLNLSTFKPPWLVRTIISILQMRKL